MCLWNTNTHIFSYCSVLSLTLIIEKSLNFHTVWTKLFLIDFFFLFSEVQCDHPPSIKDGFIEVANFKDNYIYGSKATYHCNPGFILWGMSLSRKKSMMNHMSSLFAWKKTHEGGGVERFWPFCPLFFVKSLQDWLSLEEKSNISIFAIEKLSQMSLPL